MRLSDFDYELPERLVAQEPVTPRDASRLLVLRPRGEPEDRRFAELDALLSPGDLLVLNDTKVIPARLVGRKETGGRAELLLCEPLEGPAGRRWRVMGQSSKPIREDSVLSFDGLAARVLAAEGDGFYVVDLDCGGADLESALERAGRVPLPPYVRREPDEIDRERYQTIWARAPGSAAAPTAGLHFTKDLLARLDARGVRRTTLTLHVGPGTFLPVRTESVEEHHMHPERYEVPDAVAAEIEACRARRGRVVAVGTTTVRALESAVRGGTITPGCGSTTLFIRPGHEFRAVDALVTNFHLPRSTLLMLVAAFGGRERVLSAYRLAVSRGYRFFSYGDATLLLRG